MVLRRCASSGTLPASGIPDSMGTPWLPLTLSVQSLPEGSHSIRAWVPCAAPPRDVVGRSVPGAGAVTGPSTQREQEPSRGWELEPVFCWAPVIPGGPWLVGTPHGSLISAS